MCGPSGARMGLSIPSTFISISTILCSENYSWLWLVLLLVFFLAAIYIASPCRPGWPNSTPNSIEQCTIIMRMEFRHRLGRFAAEALPIPSSTIIWPACFMLLIGLSEIRATSGMAALVWTSLLLPVRVYGRRSLSSYLE